mgnify:CR=1 FL=1
MEIAFQTKEESNKQQAFAFLKLSKTERFYSFLRLMERMRQFTVKNKVVSSEDNFSIILLEKKM